MSLSSKMSDILYLLFSKIINLYYRLENNSKSKLCILGSKSKLYQEAKVINLQNNPSKIVIGNNSHIRGTLLIYPYGDGISIGDNSFVGEGSIIRAANKIEIGNDVLIAHNVTIIDTDSHELDADERAESFKKMLKEGHPKQPGNVESKPIIIKDNVWISYNVGILKGVTIGEGAIVGAGSMVTKDVPAWSVVAGNPAHILKSNSGGGMILITNRLGAYRDAWYNKKFA